MSERTHVFQSPKGTRDFYPADMALRRHLESIWRQMSINHGFEEIDGPTFEHLDLYTVKSGEEIVSQLFRFKREGGDTDYALRPEFTPTLARMYAARAGSLPNPTKWFCIPNFFRAERPQRGRLREFYQWNVDILGDPSSRADAEVVAAAIDALQCLGLKGSDITVKFNHRELIAEVIRQASVSSVNVEAVMGLLDRRDRIEMAEFERQASSLGFDAKHFDSHVGEVAAVINEAIASLETGREPSASNRGPIVGQVVALCRELAARGILNWCEFSPSIVRGLAYYTGMVFEIHEAAGKERAIAGGGRYDGLIELYGGPPTPAVGFAMGDVVIRLVLEDKGLLKPGEEYLPRPDVFVISSGDHLAEKEFASLIARLRREGLHARHSYRATKNVGKLLGEASKVRARLAIILGKELEGGNIIIKDLESGQQRETPLDGVLHALRTMLAETA
jgi:histidyl-tRNA synthetase